MVSATEKSESEKSNREKGLSEKVIFEQSLEGDERMAIWRKPMKGHEAQREKVCLVQSKKERRAGWCTGPEGEPCNQRSREVGL